MYVAGHFADVDAADFDASRMVKVEEPKPIVILMEETKPDIVESVAEEPVVESECSGETCHAD